MAVHVRPRWVYVVFTHFQAGCKALCQWDELNYLQPGQDGLLDLIVSN